MTAQEARILITAELEKMTRQMAEVDQPKDEWVEDFACWLCVPEEPKP